MNKYFGRQTLCLRWRCIVIVAALLLVGCGNAYEHLSVNEWQEVGLSQPPMAKFKGKFGITTIREGEGVAVKPGDLVKASILVTTVPVSSNVAQHHELQAVWLWVGREPGLDFDWEQAESFGALGSGRVRRALVGRKLNERFSIQLSITRFKPPALAGQL